MKKQKLLRVSLDLIWCNFFSESINQNFAPKIGYFGFFQLTKNYAETISLIDEQEARYISQEVSYTAQKIFRRLKSPKFQQIV